MRSEIPYGCSDTKIFYGRITSVKYRDDSQIFYKDSENCIVIVSVRKYIITFTCWRRTKESIARIKEKEIELKNRVTRKNISVSINKEKKKYN